MAVKRSVGPKIVLGSNKGKCLCPGIDLMELNSLLHSVTRLAKSVSRPNLARHSE